MKYMIQYFGCMKFLVMINHDDEEIRQTFNSFFHHGAIGADTELNWVYEMNGGGKAFFLVRNDYVNSAKDKLIYAYKMMKLYKYVNEKLSINKDALTSILDYYNITDAEYDDYLCEFYEPFFEAKARDWYDSLERHTALVYQRRGIYDPMSKTWFSGKYASYYDIGVLSGGIGEHDIKSVKDRQYVERLEEVME